MYNLKNALLAIAAKIESIPSADGFKKAIGIDDAIQALTKAGIDLDNIKITENAWEKLNQENNSRTREVRG